MVSVASVSESFYEYDYKFMSTVLEQNQILVSLFVTSPIILYQYTVKSYNTGVCFGDLNLAVLVLKIRKLIKKTRTFLMRNSWPEETPLRFIVRFTFDSI